MKVILYSTGCPVCRMLKAALDNKHIVYEVESDEQKMKDMGFTSVPMLEVDGVIMDAQWALNWANTYKAEGKAVIDDDPCPFCQL